MANVKHSALTGADLHEPKGVSAATDDEFAVASSGGVNWTGDIKPNSMELKTTVWNDIRVAATAVELGPANAPDFAQLVDDGAGSEGVYTYFFSPSTEEEVFFEVQVPHTYKAGTNLRPHVHWCPTSTNTGNVVWALEYTAHSPGDVIGATTTTSVTATAPGTNLEHTISSMSEITGTTFKESQILNCRLYRDATDAADTYTGDAALLSFDFHFEVEKLGTTTEIPT